MTRGKAPDGSLQRFEYDAAGRLKQIKSDNGTLLEDNLYGSSRERVRKTDASGNKTYYAWGGSSVLAEYTEAAAATTMSWAKSYVYAGSRLLSTITKNGAAETTEYHHPDRLGTKLVTNTALNTAKSQSSLPFGTAISSETTATTNQKFTSYDRSGATGLDYAVNRTYNSGQSRFTQVDPIGMASASIGNPQSMNLFAYVQNDPVGFTDPSGLDKCSTEAAKIAGPPPLVNPTERKSFENAILKASESYNLGADTIEKKYGIKLGRNIRNTAIITAISGGSVLATAKIFGARTLAATRGGIYVAAIVTAVQIYFIFTDETDNQIFDINAIAAVRNLAVTQAYRDNPTVAAHARWLQVYSDAYNKCAVEEAKKELDRRRFPTSNPNLSGGSGGAGGATVVWGRGFNAAASANAFANWVGSIRIYRVTVTVLPDKPDPQDPPAQ